MVIEQSRIPFSFGKYYKDELMCDVAGIDVCRLLLGRPWQYDKDAIFRCKDNVYFFFFFWVKKGRIITLDQREGRNNSKGEELI